MKKLLIILIILSSCSSEYYTISADYALPGKSIAVYDKIDIYAFAKANLLNINKISNNKFESDPFICNKCVCKILICQYSNYGTVRLTYQNNSVFFTNGDVSYSMGWDIAVNGINPDKFQILLDMCNTYDHKFNLI